jgi:hypothetical protein
LPKNNCPDDEPEQLTVFWRTASAGATTKHPKYKSKTSIVTHRMTGSYPGTPRAYGIYESAAALAGVSPHLQFTRNCRTTNCHSALGLATRSLAAGSGESSVIELCKCTSIPPALGHMSSLGEWFSRLIDYQVTLCEINNHPPAALL